MLSLSNPAINSLLKIFLGGSIYFVLEILFRGYSHWSMFLLGGLCFLVCGLINSYLGPDVSFTKKMVLCMIAITILEFITGVIVNGIMGWQIWDYSNMPLQIFGQICVPFMLLWYVISFPALILNNYIDKIILNTH